MKTKTVLLAVFLIATAAIKADWQAEPLESPGELRGTISWISKEGVLVEGAFKRRVMGNTIFPGPFFLIGFNKEALSGQALDVKAVPAGTYTYTAWGSSRTVKALRYSDED